MSDEREDKLPKWARDELARLRMQIRDLEEDVSILRGEPGIEEKCLGFYSSDYTPKAGYEYTPLKFEGGSIVFKIGDDRLELSPFMYDGLTYLQVRGSASQGSSGLIVRPWVSNVILVRLED